MNPPNLNDKIVKVKAYLTDETFGYTHWRAAQFSAPKHDKYGLLLLFDTESEREYYRGKLENDERPTDN